MLREEVHGRPETQQRSLEERWKRMGCKMECKRFERVDFKKKNLETKTKAYLSGRRGRGANAWARLLMVIASVQRQ